MSDLLNWLTAVSLLALAGVLFIAITKPEEMNSRDLLGNPRRR